jgi:hypothetical protein
MAAYIVFALRSWEKVRAEKQWEKKVVARKRRLRVKAPPETDLELFAVFVVSTIHSLMLDFGENSVRGLGAVVVMAQ